MLFRKKAQHLLTGEHGERLARRHLRLRGYRILDSNYRCPLGEIDIVALKKGVIVFVEVRTRQAGALVDPVQSIDDMKLAHIMDTARYFLTAKRKSTAPCRFDIICVTSRGIFNGTVRHLIDAFRITDERARAAKRRKNWGRLRSWPGKRVR